MVGKEIIPIKKVYCMSKVKTACKNVALVSAAAVSVPSFAADSSITSAINAAVTAANSNVTIVVLGVIGLAALGFGVGMITSYLRR